MIDSFNEKRLPVLTLLKHDQETLEGAEKYKHFKINNPNFFNCQSAEWQSTKYTPWLKTDSSDPAPIRL